LTATTTLRVVIADDHPLFRIGLGYALRGLGFDVVAEAQDGLEAVERCRTLRPDAVLLDAKMPRLDGLEACRQISGAFPDTRIVMLTTFSEPALVDSARQSGAVGFLSKETEASQLAGIVRKLVADPSLRYFPHLTQEVPALSRRELEVLIQLATGRSNKEMARELGISPETVKDHLVNLYRKLETQDRVSALGKARSLGLI
jgi:DNA-binding NarL/FixJ family response regulator